MWGNIYKHNIRITIECFEIYDKIIIERILRLPFFLTLLKLFIYGVAKKNILSKLNIKSCFIVRFNTLYASKRSNMLGIVCRLHLLRDKLMERFCWNSQIVPIHSAWCCIQVCITLKILNADNLELLGNDMLVFINW